ncbi:MAG TPA: HIT family hydrolase [Acidimicrobiaceae bacterium]|jgi:ATP adenylyltransferase|nr:HIT family hydrolase [Acidimicrobiaceae bacterium]
MALEHLWATWRSAYVTGVAHDRSDALLETPSAGLVGNQQSAGRSLFENILAADASDDEKHILFRGEHCFVLLNKFPYTSGHLLVLPNRAEPDLDGLTTEEFTELWSLVRDAVVALKSGLGCDAVNVGLNLGQAAGGSQSDHLHVHCVPRWSGDANFMSVAAETRVLPVSLDEALVRVRASWPSIAP